MKPIECWFSIGSTYTWLAVVRIVEMRADAPAFDWRPFSVRVIMTEMDNLPKDKPRKLEYMWRDVERRALRLGLSPKLPAAYPLVEFDLANRVAIVAREEGWCAEYVAESYRRWLEKGDPAGSEPNLSAAINRAGHEPDRVIDRARATETGEAFARATDEARAKGIFGAPSFVVGDELFWGEDRLDDAIQWARDGALS